MCSSNMYLHKELLSFCKASFMYVFEDREGKHTECSQFVIFCLIWARPDPGTGNKTCGFRTRNVAVGIRLSPLLPSIVHISKDSETQQALPIIIFADRVNSILIYCY